MTAQRIQRLLEEKGVSYQVKEHRRAFTAQEVAAVEHISGYQFAKTVLLMADDRLVLMVVPAPMRVDLDKAREILGTEQVRFARETEFSPVFDDCEVGAIPPFGSPYGLPTFLDASLVSDEITFEAGSHDETITMSRADYLEVESPKVVEVTRPEWESE